MGKAGFAFAIPYATIYQISMKQESHPYDVFMFGLTRSDYTLSSVSVAWTKEWAKTRRVFYFDRPFSIKDVKSDWNLPQFQHRKKAVLFGLNPYKTIQLGNVEVIQVSPMMSLPLNFLPDGKLYHFLNKYNNFVLKRAMLRVIRDFKVKSYVYFNSFHPVLLPHIPKDFSLQPLANIYQSLDEISQEPYIARHGVAAETVAMQHCDIAIGTSSKLCERHATQLGRKVHLLANAADYDTFENALNKDFSKPKELENLKEPIIMYTGHYSDLRLDHALVIALTQRYAHCQIVFVGTYVEADLVKYGLNQIANLHFIGSKPIEDLPAFLKHASVAIIPYACNALTKGIYPLKINEYLAAGIPTVSTHFSDDIASFSGLIYLAANTEDFLAKVQLALDENPQLLLAARMQHARENSWKTRVSYLEKLIEDFTHSA